MVMGAAMNGLRPIGELMFSDFLATCWDIVANQIAKTRYMTGGQITLPLVLRTANGGGARFGGQHSQSVENWAMAIPGLKVVAPSTPADVVGLMAAAIRDPDPVVFLEHKALFASKGEVPDGELVDTLGQASVLRRGDHVTIVALAAMVPKAFEAAELLSFEGISTDVIDLRTLVPLDVTTVASSVAKTGRALHRRREPAALRVGRRDCLDRGRGVLLGSRRSHRAHHHATHPAARRRRHRGHGDPVSRPNRRNRPNGDAMKIQFKLSKTTTHEENTVTKRLKYLVGGEWKESTTDEWYPITNSSTGEVMAEAPRCTPEEVDEAVAAAQAAFPGMA